MKTKKNVSYFPVTASEQTLLTRVREADLSDRLEDVLAMLNQIAEAALTPATLDQAVQLLSESRQGEGLEARFENLGGRLQERIERGLAEIEGRLSKRFDGATSPQLVAHPASATTGSAPSASAPVAPSPVPRETSRPVRSTRRSSVPRAASVAFQIGPDLVWGTSASKFYIEVWRWMLEQGRVNLSDLPIKSGSKRYVIATTPIHQSGKPFLLAKEPAPGVFVEAHLSRADIIHRAKRYLEQFGVEYEVVVGSE